MSDDDFYMIVGKVIYSGLDAEGNVHLVLKNSDSAWAEAAVRFLKSVEGRVVKVNVSLWRRLRHSSPRF
jgi:hypothetical protein